MASFYGVLLGASEYIRGRNITAVLDQLAHRSAAKPRRAAAPAPSADARPVLFLHIPKTAGTSFLTTLQNVFGERHVLRLAMEDPQMYPLVQDVAQGRAEEVACLNGHLPVDIFAGYLDRFRPFTILRHPVARAFSLFRFQRKNPDIEALGLRRGFSFEEFLDATAPGIYGQLNNGMTRMLGGDPDFTSDGSHDYTDVDHHPALIGHAIALLEKIDFGLAEDMAGTHRIIEHAWNIPFALDEMLLNTTDLDNTHRDWRHVQAVVERNRLDITLYEAAQTMFRERLARLDAAPPARAPAGAAPRMVFRPTLDAWTKLDEVPGRQGFHAWFETGIAWLNEGPPARLHFAAPATSCRVGLRVFAIAADYDFERIKLTLNGAPLAFQVTERDGEWCNLESRVAALDPTLNTLSIAAPSFIRVRDLDPGSDDPRKLGIAIASLRLSTSPSAPDQAPLPRPADTPRAPRDLARLRSSQPLRHPPFIPTPDTVYPVARIAGRRGFHPIEPESYAWLKADRPATIRFHAAEGTARLRLRVHCVIPNYSIDRLALRVNGQPVAHNAHTSPERWHEIETAGFPLRPGANELRLDPSHFISLRLLDPATRDGRYLAIALQSFMLLG